MKSSAELHIAGAHIVLEKLPPSAEIIRERRSSWVLHRRGRILQGMCSYPPRITDGLIDSWKPGDFGESRHQISPCEVVGRYLEILTTGLGGVVENVAGEIAEVWQGDNRDMSLAQWRCKDACAIVENLGQEVATIEHFGVRPIGENGPLEGVSMSRERLGCEPVADSTLPIVVPAMVFRTITTFLEAIVQIRPDIVLQRRNAGNKLEDAEAKVGLRLLANGEAVCINVCAPYAFERTLDLREVGERPPSEVGSRSAFTTAWPWAPVPPITKTRLSTGSFTARLFPSRKYKTRRQRHATQPISKAA